ncbi:hypothetical protein [Streptomyces sp. N35]|uniref:hypothetical protein n=1 Tax=Streptomyces sp. N35 TaxID=2795730 RepID=UPI0035AC116B
MNAETSRRIDILPDRKVTTVSAWLRTHPAVRVVCRAGAGNFARATLEGDPTMVEVVDRRLLWRDLEAALKEVTAHSSCWGEARLTVNRGQTRAERTGAMAATPTCSTDTPAQTINAYKILQEPFRQSRNKRGSRPMRGCVENTTATTRSLVELHHPADLHLHSAETGWK